MKTELDQRLCEKYPKIFANRYGDASQTAMCWGFECGDGWYDIIDTLCGSIQNHINSSERYRDWTEKWNIDNPNNQRPVPKVCPQVVAVQVKEKFGELRFYYDGGDDVVCGLVTMAEAISQRVCEICGKPGKPRSGAWISTLCDEHAEQRAQTEEK